MSSASAIFRQCIEAMRAGELIKREGVSDKEFHFQNWFKRQLESIHIQYDSPGRNSYPDFRLVHFAEGYELKGLAYPGRDASYDANSQAPCGNHNGRQIYYVFGRYPKKPDGDSYPVLDLVLCHGSFLNADNAYVHKNRSFRGFGSYGDILVRDRKMYVVPTPFALAEGTAHRGTFIVPADEQIDPDLIQVGTLVRREVETVVGAYNFDLRTNELAATMIVNPNANRPHTFSAYRLQGCPLDNVILCNRSEILAALTSE